ncbi:ras-related protein Rab-3C isoform X1 [Cebidichthys violaceus]|uniref:ras-related protein Rab-3C isoform X1 n=2 Tax=Cottioidei TaxID=8100 RepID=UPI0035CA71C9
MTRTFLCSCSSHASQPRQLRGACHNIRSGGDSSQVLKLVGAPERKRDTGGRKPTAALDSHTTKKQPCSAKQGQIQIEPRPSKQMAATQDVKGKGEGGDQNFDYMFKLLIIGNSSVGKTSFLFRYADDAFTSAFVSTVGIDFKVKTVYKNDKRIKLQIWDTAGQERYRTITTAYYRGAMGFILMYDITNEESFGAVQDWSTQIKTYSWDNAQVVLAGNKCDMEEERVVSVDSGRLLAEQLGFEFFETSAKDNVNVKQTFERLVDLICDKMSESLDSDPAVTTGAPTAKLTDSAPPLQQPGCNC